LDPDETELVKAAVEGALAPVKELVLRAFGPLADQIGDILGDYGRQYRVRQLSKILAKTKRIADKAGIEINLVPPRILLPAVHFASLESDDALQEKWAALLASTSAEPDRIPPSFPDILHSLSPAEVRFLDRAFDNVTQNSLRVEGAIDKMPQFSTGIRTDIAIDDGILEVADEVMLDNLQRLGLVRLIPGADVTINADPVGDERDRYVITAFGRAFIRACRPPELDQTASDP